MGVAVWQTATHAERLGGPTYYGRVIAVGYIGTLNAQIGCYGWVEGGDESDSCRILELREAVYAVRI
jgi:hypothetical protein